MSCQIAKLFLSEPFTGRKSRRILRNMSFYTLRIDNIKPAKFYFLLWMAIIAAIVVSCSMVSAQEITLEEIVVTAQKREETVQDVPIAVSAYSREDLRDMGAETINDLGPYTPGLETNITDTTQPRFTIRGIQTNDFGIGTDPAVAVYVGRSGSAMLHFNDIERVEVLRGPQGTLFGRNAAAGAISIITNKPHARTEGEMGITVGDYSKAKAEGVFNTAIAEDLFFRCGVLVNQRDGYIENAAPGAEDLVDEDNRSVVGTFLWKPTKDTEVTWRLEYDHLDHGGEFLYSTDPNFINTVAALRPTVRMKMIPLHRKNAPSMGHP